MATYSKELVEKTEELMKAGHNTTEELAKKEGFGFYPLKAR